MRSARLAAGLLFVSLIAASTALGSSGSRATLEHLPPARLIGHSTSLNWSGYASFNSTFGDAEGSWTQPAATCNGKSTYSSSWVGLDGYKSSTVEQLGTEADCSNGKPVYYAWWELFPGPSRPLTLSGGGNRPESLTFGVDGAALSSAERIAEAPSLCAKSCRELPLTDFGTVNFSGVSANGGAGRQHLLELRPADDGHRQRRGESGAEQSRYDGFRLLHHLAPQLTRSVRAR